LCKDINFFCKKQIFSDVFLLSAILLACDASDGTQRCRMGQPELAYTWLGLVSYKIALP